AERLGHGRNGPETGELHGAQVLVERRWIPVIRRSAHQEGVAPGELAVLRPRSGDAFRVEGRGGGVLVEEITASGPQDRTTQRADPRVVADKQALDASGTERRRSLDHRVQRIRRFDARFLQEALSIEDAARILDHLHGVDGAVDAACLERRGAEILPYLVGKDVLE